MGGDYGGNVSRFESEALDIAYQLAETVSRPGVDNDQLVASSKEIDRAVIRMGQLGSPDGINVVPYFERSHHRLRWLPSAADVKPFYLVFNAAIQYPLVCVLLFYAYYL